MDLNEKEVVRGKVREGYARIAVSGSSCCGSNASSCCGNVPATELAKRIGYSEWDLSGLPDGANMGLSCGNPTALASLRSGETVLDLGCGAGFDVFIAGRKVGSTGRVIGVDMTPEMIARARSNALRYRESTGLDNVEFRLGEIEHLPVADASVDVVISNCVINLSPDKQQVWREIARVLKPGGRVAVTDLALLQSLPESIAGNVAALIGCIAGAVLVDETKRMMSEAGFVDIVLTPHSGYVDALADWQDALYREVLAQLPAGSKLSDFVTSLEVTARKPVGSLYCDKSV